MCLAHWKKIIFILTSGLAQRLQALVRLLRSKKSQRSIICGLLKVPRKGFEVFVVIVVYRRVVPKAKKKWATATFQQG